MKRIYKVSNETGSHLIRATNQAQAVRALTRETITCEVASQDDLVALLAQGITVKDVEATSAD